MDYRRVLEREGLPPNVVAHCATVNRVAMGIAHRIAKKRKVDVGLVDAGSWLHDIGRSKTHGITHGIVGARILRRRGFSRKICKIAECHVLAGIKKEEAVELGLPVKEYHPKTLEEKIVSYADYMVDGDRIVGWKPKARRVAKWLGKNHPIVKRIGKLEKEVKAYL